MQILAGSPQILYSSCQTEPAMLLKTIIPVLAQMLALDKPHVEGCAFLTQEHTSVSACGN